ncbi:MAG: AIR synthase family protein [Anaerolineae bacterium]
MYPIGKLPNQKLAELLRRYPAADPRLIAGGAVGQDVAVMAMGDRYLVAKTDPITFAADNIGWYAVNINANDIACSGATPRWFLATLLLPEAATTDALIDDIFSQIHRACAALNITVAGGHTEITFGLERPIVVGQMLGEVEPARLVTTAGAQPGDDLILTKGIGIEATAIIAAEKREELLPHFSAAELARYANFLYAPGISVVRDAALAVAAGGVHAMHDPTEGGIATGLHELAEAAGVGLEIWADALPLPPETGRLCRHFGLSPLGVIASGALLIAADPQHSAAIVARLAGEGIRATVIGRATPPAQGRRLAGPDGDRPLPTFSRDEITKLFE